ncbi:ABC transporter permease subunit [Beduini massiliensis]|uniref:ABC transporter permease subunit n=1 Tax=Beduini massiliensis TaxID=1585974 RepID=UPI00059AAF3B|nr:ABC transporter permease subunit [Beduini massiliensis]
MLTVLFKKEWKANYKIFLIFIAVLTLYTSVIVAMFDPKLGESLNAMKESMPQIFAAFGMTDPGLTMLDFLTNYLYGFIFIVIPFIYIIIMCHRLMSRYIDKGSMAYLLATPHTRTKVMMTQLGVLLSGLIMLIVYAVLLIIGCSTMLFDETIELGKFLMTNVGLLSIQMFFACICYLCACCFNEIKFSIGIGAGIGVASILIQMLSQVSDKMEFLKYMTPLTLFDAKGLQSFEQSAVIGMVVLFLVSIAAIIFAQVCFKKRDLPL